MAARQKLLGNDRNHVAQVVLMRNNNSREWRAALVDVLEYEKIIVPILNDMAARRQALFNVVVYDSLVMSTNIKRAIFIRSFMSFNVSRVALGGVAISGISAYFYATRTRRSGPTEKAVSALSLFSTDNCFAGSSLIQKFATSITHLTGRRWEDKLKINLMYAHEALIYTQEALPYGAVNYTENCQGVSKELLAKADEMRLEQYDAVKKAATEIVELHEIDKIYRTVAEVAKKHKIGNCGEQVAVAYIHLKYQKNLRKVEHLCLVGGDHNFIVIGRDPMSDITTPLTWGKTAVICDPWGKKYFPAEQIFDQLNALSPRTIYSPTLHSIGWTQSREVLPAELSIYQQLGFPGKNNKRQFAEEIIKYWADGDSPQEKMITSWLKDYIERKSKPKVAPLLSESELQKVELQWSSYLEGKRLARRSKYILV